MLNLLGKGKAKKGMFEGDVTNGELEIGQVAANFKDILTAETILKEIWEEFLVEKEKLSNLSF